MVASWLTKEKKSLPHLFSLASCYIGPLLILAGFYGYKTLRIAAAVVCVFGVIDTLQRMTRRDIDPFAGVMSIVGHMAVWYPYIGKRGNSTHTWIHSLGLLLVVLCVYAAFDYWPYTLSPIAGIGIAVAAGTIAST